MLFYFYDIKGYKTNKRFHFYFSFVVLVCFAGLRYKIGGDSIAYRATYDMYPNFTNFSFDNLNMGRFRIGWILYVMILRFFSTDFCLLQFSNAILLNWAIYRIVKKYSNAPFLVIFIYYASALYIWLNFEVMRECLAIAIFLFGGIDAWVQKKWSKYYIFAFLAFAVHPSAVITFLLPLIRGVDFKIKKITLFLVAFFIILLFLPAIVVIAPREFTGSYISLYILSSLKNAKLLSANYYILYLAFPVSYYCILLYCRKVLDNDALLKLLYASIFISLMNVINYTAQRLDNYILILVFIAYSSAFIKINNKLKEVIVILLFAICTNLSFFYTLYSDDNCLPRYYPYQNVFNPEQTDRQKIIERETLWVNNGIDHVFD